MRDRSRLLVDLKLLAENVSSLQEFYKQQSILFMVKADAYGHGVLPIVRYVYQELGVKEFGCATLAEAMHLREHLPDLEFEVYVFSDVQIELQDSSDFYLNRRIIPVISNQHDLTFFLEHREFSHFPLCLKFNTGMNRLGLDDADVDQVAQQLKKNSRRSVYHLMTHLACGSQSMNSLKKNTQQRERFDALIKNFQAAGLSVERTSLSNSGALEQGVGRDFSHIRPGLMLYGPSSLIPQISNLRQWRGHNISKLETYILHVFQVKKGTPIGYGARVCPREGVIAVVALGYGDGISTRFAGAHFNHGAHRGQVMGRINMDMTQILFPPEAAQDLKVGDKFTLWDHRPETVEDLSQETGALSYELFCQLTHRVPRVHLM